MKNGINSREILARYSDLAIAPQYRQETLAVGCVSATRNAPRL
ncbi:MAG: hypothetical protein SW833_16720 [Cyanobacteriota bacterium]|nr:hypothetical protein [Cyanobacteriota bacterium]